MAFRWRVDDVMLTVVFLSLTKTQKKKNVDRVGALLTKLSASAHDQNIIRLPIPCCSSIFVLFRSVRIPSNHFYVDKANCTAVLMVVPESDRVSVGSNVGRLALVVSYLRAPAYTFYCRLQYLIP